MTGFIRGLFGGKDKAEQPKAPDSQASFYLNPDDAKTFGNIDYMRSSKTVKRTFARKKGVTGELESIRKVSATESQRLREDGTPEPKAAEQMKPSPEAKNEETSFNRRQFDTNLDMFRNMAKDMKK
jgi:hypothetical protein